MRFLSPRAENIETYVIDWTGGGRPGAGADQLVVGGGGGRPRPGSGLPPALEGRVVCVCDHPPNGLVCGTVAVEELAAEGSLFDVGHLVGADGGAGDARLGRGEGGVESLLLFQVFHRLHFVEVERGGAAIRKKTVSQVTQSEDRVLFLHFFQMCSYKVKKFNQQLQM